MIFGFFKDKAKDKTTDYHNDWLKVSIFDRFLRFIGGLIVIGLGIVILTGGIDFSSGNFSFTGWLLPVLIFFLILDVLFFRIITPWIWTLIVIIFETLYGLAKDLIGMFFDLVKDIAKMFLDVGVSFLKDIGGVFGIGTKKE